MALCTMFLVTGCETVMVPSEEPLFCDVEQPRRFTTEQLDWRIENDNENLRLDFKTNKTWDRECEKEKVTGSADAL